jgi:hypothetical protein
MSAQRSSPGTKMCGAVSVERRATHYAVRITYYVLRIAYCVKRSNVQTCQRIFVAVAHERAALTTKDENESPS